MNKIGIRNKDIITGNYFDRDYFSGKKKSSYLDYRLQSFEWKWNTAIKYFKRLGSKDKDYLDIGSAFGYLVSFAQPYFRSVRGIDISSYAISEARRRYPEIDFIEADITGKNPFPDKSFDFISAIEVLEHTEDINITLNKIYQMLRPEGYGYFSMPYIGVVRNFLGWLDFDRSHISILAAQDYRKRIKETGFDIKEQKKDWWNGRIHFLVQKPI